MVSKVFRAQWQCGDDVYVVKVGSIHFWHANLEGLIKYKDANKFVQLKGVKIYLRWVQLVVKESLHTMSGTLVPTIYTSIWKSLRPRSLLALIDKGSSSWTMSHFTNLLKYNKLLKMLDTSNYVCHHIVHFSMSQRAYLDT